MKQWDFTFTHCLGGKDKGRMNVLGFEVGKIPNDFCNRHTFRDHADHRRHRNS